MTEELLLVLAPTANGHRAPLDGQREARLLEFPLMKEPGADAGERLCGGRTRCDEGMKGVFAQAAHSGLASCRVSGRPAGSSSCSGGCLQAETTEMGPCCPRKTAAPFLACRDKLPAKHKWICFMIPRYRHWRHARSDPCIIPTHEHSPHRMPQFTLEVQFSFPKHLVFQADQNKKYFEEFKHKNSLPLVPLPFLLISRAVDNT